jgi:2-amino-4-hydroxy-6-hydroxymethyldihydropteridine diphosphokinase
VRVHFSLGSNLGDRWAIIGTAVDALDERCSDLTVSPIYETVPVGGPKGQSPYLNCVVRASVAMNPQEVLLLAQDLEDRAGRVRAARNGPRSLDIDVLLIEGFTSSDPSLSVPHPRMWERAFVLAPLEDIDPDLVPPRWRARLGGEEVLASAVRKVGELVRFEGQ